MEYQQENNYPKAFFATGLIMVVLAAACYFIVFGSPPQQVDGMGGLLVNYGTTDEGSGTDQMSMEEASAAEKANHKAPDKVTPAPPTEQPSQVDNSNQKVVTQNTEDAPVVDANSKKTSTNVATTPAKPAAKAVVNQNALYKGKANPGTGAGDGTTTTPGNQGSPNGSTLSDNYGPGGSGAGLHMNNWSAVSAPEPKNIHRVPGTVIIDFTIDDTGNVLEAHADKKTTADLSLIQSCVDAIKATKFQSKTPANGNQRGQYTFLFRVD